MVRKPKIFTPLDPRWDDFITALNYHLKDCDGTFRLSRVIMEARYKEINIEKTIEYFNKNEWFCDCDLLTECPLGLGMGQEEIIAPELIIRCI